MRGVKKDEYNHWRTFCQFMPFTLKGDEQHAANSDLIQHPVHELQANMTLLHKQIYQQTELLYYQKALYSNSLYGLRRALHLSRSQQVWSTLMVAVLITNFAMTASSQ